MRFYQLSDLGFSFENRFAKSKFYTFHSSVVFSFVVDEFGMIPRKYHLQVVKVVKYGSAVKPVDYFGIIRPFQHSKRCADVPIRFQVELVTLLSGLLLNSKLLAWYLSSTPATLVCHCQWPVSFVFPSRGFSVIYNHSDW